MADSRAGAEMNKMSMEHLVVPESKEGLKNQNKRDMSEGCRSQREISGQSWGNLSNKVM